jgi:hypothetical protein
VVAEAEDIASVAEEYAKNEQFRDAAVAVGATLKYSRIRKLRPDGACFYRGWLFSVLRYMSTNGAKSPSSEVAPIESSHGVKPAAASSAESGASASASSSSSSSSASLSASALPPLVPIVSAAQDVYERLIGLSAGALARFATIGLDPMVTEDFIGVFDDMLLAVPGSTPEVATAAVSTEGEAMYALAFVRYLTSLGMHEHAELVTPTATALGSPDLAAFRRSQVEATAAEADHVAIACLAAVTGIPIAIVSMSSGALPAVAVFPAGASASEAVVHLLLRPGHYDVLEPSDDTAAALAAL